MMTSSVVLGSVLNASVPVFLASSDPRNSRITLHVTAGCDMSLLETRVAALLKANDGLRLTVCKHNLRRLAFPRSLEHWLGLFSGEDVIYDPTMIGSRARALVLAARACRASFGEAIRGLFFDPESGGLLIHVRRGPSGALPSLQGGLRDIVSSARDEANGGWRGGVQVVSDLPRRKLVPVDLRSAAPSSRLARFLRRWRTPGAIAIAMSAAASLPAAAHTENGYPIGRTVRAALSSKDVPTLRDYGVLASLSMFREAPHLEGSKAFVAVAMKAYFGEIRVAQAEHRRHRNPNEVGQVGGS